MRDETASRIIITQLLMGALTLAFQIQPIGANPKVIVVPDDYPSIQQAVDNANEGDTIYVRKGGYGENVVISKSLILIGEASAPPTWDFPRIIGWMRITASNVKVRRLKVTPTVFPVTGVFIINVKNVEISQVLTSGDEGGPGIHLKNSSNNLIAYNWVYAMPMSAAIALDESHNNTIVGNYLVNFEGNVGLSLHDSSGNRIFHNSFLDNPVQASSFNSVNNIWDDGYPSGGNYWSDYAGADQYNGPYQNETGSDGIGDIPYDIDVDNRDRYPLMSLWSFPWGDWDHYHNYSEIVNTLLYLNATYPNIVDVFSIGRSWQDRDIYCIRLTNESNTHPKPEVLFVGYHHAREPISAELPLYFAVEAAMGFETNATITNMINYGEIYIVPALNVDAFEAVKQNEWQRKNVHSFDEDNDGLFDEDAPDDEDGDGYIEDLFYWDGSNYYFIRWEGIDDDGDGLYNEDWVGGVDLNRNYAYQWDAQCDSGSPYPWAEDFRGPAPFSEPETQAIRDLALSHNFKYAISFHSGTEVVGYPWGYTTDPTPDDATFEEIAANLSQLVSAPYGQNSGLYTASGMWDDWMYENRSTFAFTCEIYENWSAWQYEPGPDPDTWWEKGVFQFFNPDPSQIETVIQRWLPVFTYITNRAITEAYDVATTNVTPLKTIVGQGFYMHINVTVANQGDFTETLDVTLYANTSIIQTKTITLTSRNSVTVTFTWDTSGFAKANYTISAVASPVPGETHTANNRYEDGWVIVAMPCDIAGSTTTPPAPPDGKVDYKDVFWFLKAYGSDPTKPNWNPNCDVADSTTTPPSPPDDKVDYKDIFWLLKNYGKTDP